MTFGRLLLLPAVFIAVGMGGCGDTSSSEAPVEAAVVFIDDGAVQCTDPAGRPLEEDTQKLEAAGVHVRSAECGERTDIMVIAQCGAGDNGIHVFTIDAGDLPQAESLGFRSVETIAHDGEAGYIVTECRS